jgi:hypothetical protein
MSSHRKERLKLSENGVVTGEAMIAYLHNELAADDRQEMEKLLQEDPFALDAMEGLKSAPANSNLASSLVAVNKRIRERSGVKEKGPFRLHWTTYAWAAAILGLLVGIGCVMVFMMGSNDKNMAMNNKATEQQSQPIIVSPQPETPAKADTSKAAGIPAGDLALAKDSLAKLPSGNLSAPSGVQGSTAALSNGPVSAGGSTGYLVGHAAATGNGGVAAATGNIAANKSPAATLLPGSAGSVAANSNASAQLADRSKVMAAVPVKQAELMARGTGKSAVADSTTKTNGNKTAPAITMDAAMQSFYNADYKLAASNFDNILKTDPDNAQALYFGGISDYINGQTAKSETAFDKILKKGTVFVDGAKWYKANILVKKGDREHAKALLQDLSNSNGSYKERAVKLMAELNF